MMTVETCLIKCVPVRPQFHKTCRDKTHGLVSLHIMLAYIVYYRAVLKTTSTIYSTSLVKKKTKNKKNIQNIYIFHSELVVLKFNFSIIFFFQIRLTVNIAVYVSAHHHYHYSSCRRASHPVRSVWKHTFARFRRADVLFLYLLHYSFSIPLEFARACVEPPYTYLYACTWNKTMTNRNRVARWLVGSTSSFITRTHTRA